MEFLLLAPLERVRKAEDKLRKEIEAGEADESALDHLQLPAVPYVSTTLDPVSVPG